MSRSLIALSLCLPLVLIAGCKSQGHAGCDDLISTYAERLVECGEYTSQREAEEALLAGLVASTPPSVNGCEDFVRLRDVEEFGEECIPQIETLPCGTDTLPAACQGQLLFEE